MTQEQLDAMTAEQTLSLILRAFKIFDGFCGVDSSLLGWRTDGEYAPVSLYVNCNDLFYWGCADSEKLTVENISELEKAAEDIKKINPEDFSNADILFCCRMRKMRPQKPYYKYIPNNLKPLFDACGEERNK